MLTAITRGVSASLASCELTWLAREPIDIEKARAEHSAYECCLASLGVRVISLPPLDEHPDAVFVEDPAIVLDEVAVITTMGAASRRGERASLAAALADFRPVIHMQQPARLEGGDVMRVGRHLYVGVSGRRAISRAFASLGLCWRNSDMKSTQWNYVVVCTSNPHVAVLAKTASQSIMTGWIFRNSAITDRSM